MRGPKQGGDSRIQALYSRSAINHSERIPDPEARAELPFGVLEVVPLREVPVQFHAEEVEGDAVADGSEAVLQLATLDEFELVPCLEVRAVVIRGADVEEQRSSDLLEHEDRRGQDVDEREAELEVAE